MNTKIIRARKIRATALLIAFCATLVIPLAAHATADRTFSGVSTLQQTGIVGPNPSGRMHTANSGGRNATRIDFTYFRRANNSSPWHIADTSPNREAHTLTARPWRGTTVSSTQWQARANINPSHGSGNGVTMSGRIFAQHAR